MNKLITRIQLTVIGELIFCGIAANPAIYMYLFNENINVKPKGLLIASFIVTVGIIILDILAVSYQKKKNKEV